MLVRQVNDALRGRTVECVSVHLDDVLVRSPSMAAPAGTYEWL